VVAASQVREYSLDGRHLRTLPQQELGRAGVWGVTSVAWMKGNSVLLGMTFGNRIAVVDTAPDPPAEPTDFDDYREPPGEDYDEDLVRERNLVSVERIVDVPPGTIPQNSLEAVSYTAGRDAILFSSSAGPSAGVFEVTMDGEGRQVLGGGRLGDVGSIDAVYWSDQASSYLMWCSSCATLSEVPERFGTPQASREFGRFLSGSGASVAASFDVSPEGGLLLIANVGGEVSFYCSGGQSGDEGLGRVVRSGEQPDVDVLYFWRTVEIQQSLTPEDSGGLGSRSGSSDLYTHLFGIECLDADVFVIPVPDRVACEEFCSVASLCGAYTYVLEGRSCKLKSSCGRRAMSPRASSGVKGNVQRGGGGAPSRPAPQPAPAPAPRPRPPQPQQQPAPPPPAVPDAGFEALPRVGCNDPTFRSTAGGTFEDCRARCGADGSCQAFTYNFRRERCFLKSACSDREAKDNDISGVRLARGARPPEAYRYLFDVGCKDRHFRVLRDVTTGECQSACSQDTDCRAFTANLDDCFLKRSCDDQETERDDLSGIKQG